MTIGIQHEGQGFERHLTNGNPICTFAVRSQFDKLNLEMALARGAEFDQVNEIEEIRQEAQRVVLKVDGKEIDCRYLIGADGANGVVRRLCSPEPKAARGFALEGTVAYSSIGHEPRAEIIFGVVDHGYGWLFPKGDHVNIGIYSCNNRVRLGKDILRQYGRERIGVGDIDHIVGYPLGFGADRFAPDLGRIALIGDAGGFAEPLLGEGLHNAIKSGQGAARAIIECESDGHAPDAMGSRFNRHVRDVRADVRRCRQLALRAFYPRLGQLGPRALKFPIATSALLNGFAAARTIRDITNTFLWSGLYKPVSPASLSEFRGRDRRLAA